MSDSFVHTTNRIIFTRGIRKRAKIDLPILAIQKWWCLDERHHSSKIPIASDLWTSKNSVYVFAGTVAFWIDNNWELRETTLELLPLSGDHSEKASRKLI